MLNVYADESCADSQRYLILGGIAVEAKELDAVTSKLIDERYWYDTFGEVKWTKVSNAKLNFYKAFVDVFFELSKRDILHFHSLYVDTSTFNHHRWNQGSAEIGFNKLIYQLLLHRFGRRYGDNYKIYVFLDERTTKKSPEAIKPMLNSALSRDWNIKSQPFRRITFQNSKKSEILQLNDLLIGAIGFRKHGHHHKPGSSIAKIELAEYIARKSVTLQHPIRVNSPNAVKFSLWQFEFKKRILRA